MYATRKYGRTSHNSIMLKKVPTFVIIFLIYMVAGQSTSFAQIQDYEQLAAYLKSKPNDWKTIPLVIAQLERSGTDQPLEELVRWAQTGFPEFQDKSSTWRIDVLGFHSNFEHSLYYFIEQIPAPQRGARYLGLIDELLKYGQFTHPLTQNAYKFLNEEELVAEFYRLARSKHPEERSRAFVLGLTAAGRSKDIATVYFQAVKEDAELQPRYSALVYIAMNHAVYPREIALAGLDRLLHDTDKRVREFGGVIVRQSADFREVWADEDLPLLLSEMVKSSDAETRRTLAMTVARMTTSDKALYVDEKKWEAHPENMFLALVSAGETEDKLVELWREWWTPLIPRYTVKRTAIVCE